VPSSTIPADWLRPEWQVPGAMGLMTTRAGGVSAAPFDTLNIRGGVGDVPEAVAENRRRLECALAAAAGGSVVRPVYLRQVHGIEVARLSVADAASGDEPEADAALTTDFGVACTAQVADCMPVLFAAPGGVAAAHAGWRGLAGGVLEATLAALCDATGCAPQAVQAWLGPCIGPSHFEVGADVLAAFGADADPAATRAATKAANGVGPNSAFTPRGAAFGPGRWLADLPKLAHQRLAAHGVGSVIGGHWCTVASPSRFFSYRRDGVTGRMVACIWRQPGT